MAHVFYKSLIAMLAVAIGVPVSAQVKIEPDYEAAIRKAFDTDQGTTLAPCEVTPTRPELDFSLRFQTGFTMGLLASQLRGPHHRGVILLRVTPEAGQPAYLVSRVELHNSETTNLPLHVRGSFAVVEGKYNVEMIFGDEVKQICRSQWHIEAKLDANMRRLSLSHVPSLSDQPHLGRLTILMHVAPPSPRSAKLPASDNLQLLGSLCALLQQLHAQSARLVVFDLRQQKVLFRKDEFTVTSITEVAKLIDDAPFGTVDYSALSNPKGAAGLLTQLTEEERGKLQAADTLVFLGLQVDLQGSMRGNTVKKIQNGPRIFYLECGRPPSILRETSDSGPGITAESSTVPSHTPDATDMDYTDPVPEMEPQELVPSFTPREPPDFIEQLVKRMKGETILIRQPADCARAIRRISMQPASNGH